MDLGSDPGAADVIFLAILGFLVVKPGRATSRRGLTDHDEDDNSRPRVRRTRGDGPTKAPDHCAVGLEVIDDVRRLGTSAD